MKFIKRHMGLVFVCLLTIILLVIMFIIFSRMIFSSGKSEYGDRLNGIVSIKKDVLNEVEEKIKGNDEVAAVSIRTQGKIIYTVITFTDKVKKEKAKEIATKSLENYSEEVMECYDFEFLLTQEAEENDEEVDLFTVAGTKSPDNKTISWTKN